MAAGDVRARSALIHREVLQLAALLCLAIAAFFVTRAIARSNHEMSVRDGEEWYRRGQSLIAHGRVDAATEAFRHAIVRDRDENRYGLALAQALILQGDHEGARATLLTLRASAPENPDINLQLARLAAARQDVTEAVRFYRNALYATWAPEQTDARRQVRLELVRLLLARNQLGRGQAELLAASVDLTDDVASHREVAQLFAQATDHRHSLDQFQRVLALAPNDPDALVGAGQEAFHLGDYALALKYLRQTPAARTDVRDTREVAELILSNDPFAARIGGAERRRRLGADLSYAHQRLQTCVDAAATSNATQTAPEETKLLAEATSLAALITTRGTLEQDTVEAGMDVIARIEQQIAPRCGPPTAFDQALALIGRQHGADAR